MTSQRDNKRYSDTIFTHWRKSSHSYPNGNECVEVSFSISAVGMRDSHHPDAAVLIVGHSEWKAFLDSITTGEFRALSKQ